MVNLLNLNSAYYYIFGNISKIYYISLYSMCITKLLFNYITEDIQISMIITYSVGQPDH